MAEEGRPISRKDFVKLLLGVIAGGTVGAATGGAAGSASSGDFVQLRPSANQILQSQNMDTVALLFESFGSGSADAIRGRTHTGTLTINMNPQLGILSSQIMQLLHPTLGNAFGFASAEDSPAFPDSGRVVWGSGIDDRWNDDLALDPGPSLDGGWINPISFTPIGGTQFGLLIKNLRGLSTDDIKVESNLKTGAQVGLPTGAAGTAASGFCGPTHRHAFSGKFIPTSCYFPTAVGAGLPLLKLRIKSTVNWTLRRVYATATVAPIGGNETFGIVNAAGALQGTAVTLTPAAPDNETALFTANLTGSTVYYFAQTASTSVTQATDISVGIEYQMNA